jgi:DNA-binding response OmpR family regulator
MQGYEVFESPNGEVAIDLLEQQPKLVILDLASGHCGPRFAASDPDPQ